MEEYQELLKMLKVANQNIQILHRHLAGTNWFGTHKVLDEYQEHIQKDIDRLCELGLSIEIDEPTMQESLNTYKEVEIRNRSERDSYIIVKDLFNDIIAQINRIGSLPEDVINILQEVQAYYRIEANYKLFRATLDKIEE